MSEDDKKPTDLIEFKLRKSETAQKVAWESGDGFRFMNQPYNTEDIGIVEDDETPVVLLTPGFGDATGLRMSVEDAEKIGVELIQAAGMVRAERAQGDGKEAG